LHGFIGGMSCHSAPFYELFPKYRRRTDHFAPRATLKAFG
jgi:hypothetical protein